MPNAETEDGEVRRHDVCRVFGATESRLNEGEPCLHEHHERGSDDDPQQADLLSQDRYSICRFCEH
jgi:hypothetical protein